MVKPERRTRADLLAAASIVVVIAVAAALIWWVSDARHTDSSPATIPLPQPTPAVAVPLAVAELWTTPSPATTRPVLMDGTVVVGAGPQMSGRDPQTGETVWSFRRGVDLCGVSWVYRYAVAVYPDRRGCGQVSAIDASTGRRGPARSSYADETVRLSSDGTALLSAGRTRLETWRSDLVRTLSYGEIDARVKPSARGRNSGCTLGSAAASAAAVSVLESCADRDELSLTLLRPGKDEDEPEQRDVPLPGVGAESTARVLAVVDTTTAVYLPSPHPHVAVIDETGATVSATALRTAPSGAAVDAVAVSRAGALVTWWTGDAVAVFDSADLTYRYTLTETADTGRPVGPATMMADRLLVPVTAGVAVYQPETGVHERTIALSRPSDAAAVIAAVSGSTILEQRGDTLVALG
ncbi:PQQ-binding-like beta-propeller repeat protein [Mycobacterium koreense]|uniref:Uncharacterized protein n=1 Tax=Mycolicibacillus koreensis TaxID=1069220 RepID=A0A7I7SCS4_9MYCO|nr:PQQ-binding-like beta-propeller repeat protein [Mycolicibacillus koreensis]MCV7249928.1 PQQ-binding-like beta-propeller repeat protein [Mycolicibacillus koreensis]OSC34854.1 hypothetical protein B8W67_04850 [Mycolicibacillus koreensis]BBY54717.1 hypothetical protein MKOR_19680 [Mycolicibacillus koreensis]